TGWVVDGGSPRAWRVEDGELVATGRAPGTYTDTGWLLTERSYADFRLRFEFRLSAGANSGVALRAVPGEKTGDSPIPERLAVQILDERNYRKPDGTIPCPTGSLYWARTGRTCLPTGSPNSGRSVRGTKWWSRPGALRCGCG